MTVNAINGTLLSALSAINGKTLSGISEINGIAKVASGDSGPELISGLQLWLNANTIAGASTGDQISTWNDDSGNSRNATGVVINTLKPTYRASDGPNSKPCVRMVRSDNGQGGYFTLPDFLTALAATSGHYFVIVKIDNDPPSNNNEAAPPHGDWGASTDEYFVFPSDSGIYDGWGSSARKTTGNPTPALTSWRLYEIRTASGAWSSHIDGTQHFTTATNTVQWSTAPKIGRSTSSNKFMHGLIAEICFYNTVLTGGDLSSIKSYFSTKYSLTIA